jgi:RNA polymerase sigma factor (sigma-70 family)
MSAVDDLGLVRRALTRDRGAQRQLAERLLDPIHREVAIAVQRRAASHGRDARQEVLDLVQEVLIALFERDGQELRRWDPERGRNLDSFVRLVARRKVARVLGQLRGNPWALASVDAASGIVDDEPLERIEHRDALEAVLDALYAGMDTRDAELFELLFVDDLDADEVAKRMGMTAGAVNAWRYRVRKAARQLARQTVPSTEVTSSTPGHPGKGRAADGR